MVPKILRNWNCLVGMSWPATLARVPPAFQKWQNKLKLIACMDDTDIRIEHDILRFERNRHKSIVCVRFVDYFSPASFFVHGAWNYFPGRALLQRLHLLLFFCCESISQKEWKRTINSVEKNNNKIINNNEFAKMLLHSKQFPAM